MSGNARLVELNMLEGGRVPVWAFKYCCTTDCCQDGWGVYYQAKHQQKKGKSNNKLFNLRKSSSRGDERSASPGANLRTFWSTPNDPSSNNNKPAKTKIIIQQKTELVVTFHLFGRDVSSSTGNRTALANGRVDWRCKGIRHGVVLVCSEHRRSDGKHPRRRGGKQIRESSEINLQVRKLTAKQTKRQSSTRSWDDCHQALPDLQTKTPAWFRVRQSWQTGEKTNKWERLCGERTTSWRFLFLFFFLFCFLPQCCSAAHTARDQCSCRCRFHTVRFQAIPSFSEQLQLQQQQKRKQICHLMLMTWGAFGRAYTAWANESLCFFANKKEVKQ